MAGSGRRRLQGGGRRTQRGGRYVVVVESPAKAKTIGAWLGPPYRVMATRGHVRDLPAKAGSVDPGDGFSMVYETGKAAARTLGAIARALENAEGLILATDPDREGEAIAWQVLDWLTERDAIGGRRVERATFHEVTEEAVRAALDNPRGIDMDLVRAWQARRALDYLVGYSLSPVLWRKLPGCRSAGRVTYTPGSNPVQDGSGLDALPLTGEEVDILDETPPIAAAVSVAWNEIDVPWGNGALSSVRTSASASPRKCCGARSTHHPGLELPSGERGREDTVQPRRDRLAKPNRRHPRAGPGRRTSHSRRSSAGRRDRRYRYRRRRW